MGGRLASALREKVIFVITAFLSTPNIASFRWIVYRGDLSLGLTTFVHIAILSLTDNTQRNPGGGHTGA